MQNALSGIDKLKENVDTIIVIPNDKLLEVVDRRTTMPEALKKADEVLQQGIQGITDLINVPSLINLDFADIQTVMKDKGIAHIGIGAGRGDDKALEAVKKLLRVRRLRRRFRVRRMLSLTYREILLLWMLLMRLIMYRNLQEKAQVLFSVLCMMTRSQMNVRSLLLRPGYIM